MGNLLQYSVIFLQIDPPDGNLPLVQQRRGRFDLPCPTSQGIAAALLLHPPGCPLQNAPEPASLQQPLPLLGIGHRSKGNKIESHAHNLPGPIYAGLARTVQKRPAAKAAGRFRVSLVVKSYRDSIILSSILPKIFRKPVYSLSLILRIGECRARWISQAQAAVIRKTQIAVETIVRKTWSYP